MSDQTRIQRQHTADTLVSNKIVPAKVAAKNIGAADQQKKDVSGAAAGSFSELLRARQGIASSGTPSGGDLRFSAHAQNRLQSRQIPFGAGELDRLQGAVQRAASKGSRDALVLMDDIAMVVSIANRTVVTVVDKDSLKQNVFTNIDSAVIA